MKLDLKSWLTGYILGVCGKPLPIVAKKEPTSYSYNGVVLPKLPEWDRERYPWAVICLMLDTALYGYQRYYAMAASSTFSTNDGKVHNVVKGLCCITDENGEWGEWKDIAGGQTMYLLWANHDIFYSSGAGGTLYLAASDPVPVGETPPIRLKGYSYNGAILPALPEYDAEKYPYALVVYQDDSATPVYECFAYASNAEWDLSALKKPRFGYDAAYLYWKVYPTISTGVAPVTWGWQESGESGKPTLPIISNVIWANFTGQYDGTVYWETSDNPTPVYE